MSNRSADRKAQGFDDATRLVLVEGDTERLDRRVDRLSEEFATSINRLDETIERQGQRTDERLGRISTLLTGVLVSITTASILLALNVLLSR